MIYLWLPFSVHWPEHPTLSSNRSSFPESLNKNITKQLTFYIPIYSVQANVEVITSVNLYSPCVLHAAAERRKRLVVFWSSIKETLMYEVKQKTARLVTPPAKWFCKHHAFFSLPLWTSFNLHHFLLWVYYLLTHTGVVQEGNRTSIYFQAFYN